MTYDPGWPDTLKRQEELLRFGNLTNEDALTLGLYALDQARAFGKAFSVRVILHGMTVFTHHMDGTGLYHDWWMDKKLNTSRETGVSTLRLFSEIQAGLRPRPAFLDDELNYAWDGGCVPMRGPDGRVLGYVIASGASHELDHEVAVRAMARFLNVDIPSVALS